MTWNHRATGWLSAVLTAALTNGGTVPLTTKVSRPEESREQLRLPPAGGESSFAALVDAVGWVSESGEKKE